MQRLNKNSLIISGVIILAAVIISYVYVSTQQSLVPETTEPTFLYVQTAHSGSFTPADEEDLWELTLNNVSPNTTYFSDRPNRITGHESTEEFILNWNEGENSFAENPPNAALDLVDNEGEQHVLVFELLDVVYDSKTKVLSYDVVVLSEDLDDPTLFNAFENAALFIDSTYKSYNCKCDIPSGGSCSCENSYKLGHGETKEFRVSCYGSGEGTEIHITKRKDTTTCTFSTSYGLGYITKSCTNWHTSKHDELKIRTQCEEPDESDYDYDG